MKNIYAASAFVVCVVVASTALGQVPIERYMSLGGGSFSSDVTYDDDVQLFWGSSDDAVCLWDTGQTPDGIICGVGSDSRVWILTEKADVDTDYGHAQQTNPTQYWHSADATSTSDYVCIAHDQTDGAIRVGSGDLGLGASIAAKTVTIDTFGNCITDTVTVTVNGTDSTCVEGTDWTAVTDNDTSATNLEVCIEAVAGVDSTVATNVVTLQHPLDTTLSISLAIDDATCATVSNGTDGEVNVYNNINLKGIGKVIYDADADTYCESLVDDQLKCFAGGLQIYTLVPTRINVLANIDIGLNGSSRIYDVSGALNIGATATTGHSLVSGDVISGGSTEFDGTVWIDSGLRVADNISITIGSTSSTDAIIAWRLSQTPDTLMLGVGVDSRNIVIAEQGDLSTDFAHALEANPTLFIQSSDQTTIADWISLAHDQTNGVISTGSGNITLNPSGVVMMPDGKLIQAANGSGTLDLRNAGVNNAVALSGDTVNFTMGWLYAEGNLAEIGFGIDTDANQNAAVIDVLANTINLRTETTAGVFATRIGIVEENITLGSGVGEVIVASGTDIRTDAWTAFASTIVGWTTTTSALVNYKKVGNLVYVQFHIEGESNTTTVTFTLPFTQVSTNGVELKVAIQAQDAGTISTTSGLLVLAANSATVNCFKDMAGAVWTNTGTKRVQGQFWFEAQ